MDRLDTLLLFFSSSLSIGFSLIFAFFGKEVLFSFLPALFLGWVMPIYVGYVRGSLILDQIEERVRGWIYLIMGTGLYSVLTVFFLVLNKTDSSSRLVLVSLGIEAFLIYFSFKFNRYILELFGEQPTSETYWHFRNTILAAVFIACTFILLNLTIEVGSELARGGPIYPLLIILTLFSFCGFILFERIARH